MRGGLRCCDYDRARNNLFRDKLISLLYRDDRARRRPKSNSPVTLRAQKVLKRTHREAVSKPSTLLKKPTGEGDAGLEGQPPFGKLEGRLIALFTGVLEGAFHGPEMRDGFSVLGAAFYAIVAEPHAEY